MFPEIYAGISLLGLAYASYTDLKERMVSNKLSLALLVCGLGLHLLESLETNSFTPLLFSLAAGTAMFIFSYALWKLGAWAGGDVKLFTALATLLPLPFMGSFPNFYLNYPAFPFTILANSVLLSFPFILVYVIWKTVRNKKLHKHFSKMFEESMIWTIIYSLSVIGFSFALEMLSISQIWLIPVLILVKFLPGISKLFVPMPFFVLAIALKMDTYGAISTIAGIFAFMMLFQAMTYGRKYALRDHVATRSLKEGMIPAETLYLKAGKILKYEPTLMQRLAKPFHEPPGVIISSTKAAGLEPEDIARLKKLGITGVMVKESVPMVPMVLLGTISSLFLGDLVWIISRMA